MYEKQQAEFDQTERSSERTLEQYMPATPSVVFESRRVERIIGAVFRRRGYLRAERD